MQTVKMYTSLTFVTTFYIIVFKKKSDQQSSLFSIVFNLAIWAVCSDPSKSTRDHGEFEIGRYLYGSGS